MLTWVTGIRIETMIAQERKGRAGVTNMSDIIRDQNVDMGYRIRIEEIMAQERKGRAGVTNMSDIIRDQNVDMGYRNKD